MNKKLAFWGDCNGYGYKIIRILEELGGINVSNYAGNEPILLYYIDKKNHIKGKYNGDLDKEKYVIMTYHDFITKYPFQVGDIVYTTNNHEEGKVLEIIWSETKGVMYLVDFKNTTSWVFVDEIFSYVLKDNSEWGTAIEPIKVKSNMIDKEDKLFDSIIWHLRNSVNNGKQNLSGGECEEYFREVVKKNNENKMKNVLAELLEHIKTTPKEDLEREFEELEEWSNVGPTVEEFRTFCESVNKKPTYPKTYKECCDVLLIPPYYNLRYHTYEPNYEEYATSNNLLSLEDKLNTLGKLIICCQAYWKIAGEEMGLGKPWESPLPSLFETVHCIRRKNNKIIKGTYRGGKSEILEFPTEEIRDAFYENFKVLIEQCKELL